MLPARGDRLTIHELSAATGVPVATIRRYKRRGLIPFFQPGGPGCRVWFPPDALDGRPETAPAAVKAPAERAPSRLPGPGPRWKQNHQRCQGDSHGATQ